MLKFKLSEYFVVKFTAQNITRFKSVEKNININCDNYAFHDDLLNKNAPSSPAQEIEIIHKHILKSNCNNFQNIKWPIITRKVSKIEGNKEKQKDDFIPVKTTKMKKNFKQIKNR